MVPTGSIAICLPPCRHASVSTTKPRETVLISCPFAKPREPRRAFLRVRENAVQQNLSASSGSCRVAAWTRRHALGTAEGWAGARPTWAQRSSRPRTGQCAVGLSVAVLRARHRPRGQRGSLRGSAARPTPHSGEHLCARRALAVEVGTYRFSH